MKKNTILTNVTIDLLNPKGVGIIRVTGHDRPVEVSGGVFPGMVCDVRIIRKTRHKIIGRLIAVHDAGPYATQEPRCDHTLQSPGPEHKVGCGGCKWQIIAYEDQLALKRQSIEQSLYSQGIACEVSSTLPSPTVRGYRNKMEYSFGNYITGRGEDKRILSEWSMGFHKQGQFGKIVDIDYCYLVDDEFNTVMQHMKKLLQGYPTYDQRRHNGVLRYCMIRQGTNTGEYMVVLSISTQGDLSGDITHMLQNDEWLRTHVTTMLLVEHDGLGGVLSDQDSKRHVLWGEGVISESLCIGGQSFYFVLSPQSFFQTNTTGAELLYDQVAHLLAESQATTLYDLYCGTGTIGQIIGSLVPSIQHVVGIDIVPEAIDNARHNAEQYSSHFGSEYYVGAVEKILPGLTIAPHSTIIVDPPRAGLQTDAITTLNAVKKVYPDLRLCYVSCNPVTLGRDLSLLQESYRVDSVQPVDMFPHTHHVETVVGLS